MCVERREGTFSVIKREPGGDVQIVQLDTGEVMLLSDGTVYDADTTVLLLLAIEERMSKGQ